MAVRGLYKRKRLAVRTEEVRALARPHLADLAHRHAHGRGFAAQCLDLAGANAAEDLVIVAASDDGPDQRSILGERGARAQSISAATPEARQSLARSPASPSDTSIAAEA